MALLVDVLAAGVVDANGEPLSNGVVYVYQTGTTTKQDVYTDSDLTVPAPNPITLDAAGKAEVYVNSAVRLVIEDSDGNAIDDIESVGEVASLSGDATIGTNSSNFIQINSQIRGDLDPDTPDTYDIGDSINRWRKLYVNIIGENVTIGDGTENDTDPDLTINQDGGDAVIRLQVNNSSSNAWDIRNDNSDDDKLHFQFNGVTQFTLDGDGDAELRAASGSSAELIINAQGGQDAVLALRVNDSGATQWNIRNDNNDGDHLKFQYNSNTQYIFNAIASSTNSLYFDSGNAAPATTPPQNAIFGNSIVKAWGDGESSVNDGVNCSISDIGTGYYSVSFQRNMANANYAAVATANSTFSNRVASVDAKFTSGFDIFTTSDDTTSVDVDSIMFIVVGEN